MQDAAVHALADLLACPVSGEHLERSTAGWRAASGTYDYPDLGTAPCLVPSPGQATARWQAEWQLSLAEIDAERARALDAAGGAHGPTRRRLERLAEACRGHRALMGALLAPLLTADPPDAATCLALKTERPAGPGLLSYYANAARDWVWGDAENAASADLVREALVEPCEQLLVLGCGAGRLAYDLHQTGWANLTVALDLSPFLILIAERVTRGEDVRLYEFPVAPKRIDDLAVERTLRAPVARPGLHYLIGDAYAPPFRPAVFDAVVAPWFVDVTGRPLEDTLRAANGLLKPGGRWVQFGSLAFHDVNPAHRRLPEELSTVYAAAGFEMILEQEHTLPYMMCPNSRHGRLETILLTGARKTGSCNSAPPPSNTPLWIADPSSPIPALPSFTTQAQTTRIHAYIMSLIDGKRSIRDVARILDKHKLMDAVQAEGVLPGFFEKMWREADTPRWYR